MKFKLEIDFGDAEGDIFSRLQEPVLTDISNWLGTIEWRFDGVKVPPVRLPLPLDEVGRSSQPIVNKDGVEIGYVGFFTVEPATVQNNEGVIPPPFKAPQARR